MAVTAEAARQLVLVQDPNRVRTVTIKVACPLCGGDLRVVNVRKPKGIKHREQGLVVACNAQERSEPCRWEGEVEFTLKDLQAPPVKMGRRRY